MPSGMDAISAIGAVGSTTIVTAADGVTIGAARRLTTARIESRRGNRVQNFTPTTWHMVRRKRRSPASHFRQVMLCDRLAANGYAGLTAKIVLNQSLRAGHFWIRDSIRTSLREMIVSPLVLGRRKCAPLHCLPACWWLRP